MPEIGRFISIDPLSEKFTYQSLYIYADNNPIKFIDKNGMNADGYVIDEDGNIDSKPVNNEGGDKYDVIYRKDSYSEDTRKEYDESGDKSGIKVSTDFIDSKKSETVDVVDMLDEPTGKKITAQSHEVKSDSEAAKIMNFMEKNTNVEWGNTLLTGSDGTNINLLTTSHEPGAVSLATYWKETYKYRGFKIVRDDHIHPSGSSKASGHDDAHWKSILKWSPNAKFRILTNGTYYPKIPRP